MQRVLHFSRMREAEPYMDAKVLSYINEGQIQTFESFSDFDIMAFDWYDVESGAQDCPQILIYLDREDLFFFCETPEAERRCASILQEITGENVTNGQALYRFFGHFLKGDVARLDQLETEITDTESEVLSGSRKGFLDEILDYRRELLRLKRYYEQMSSIFDELAANDNELLSRDTVRRFTILTSRAERYLTGVANLREYVAQMREAYQAQIDIQQNELMKVFTVVTAVFMPLTLLVGWYGMNFQMPELQWAYGYPVVIGISVVTALCLILYFKKRRWF